MQKKEQPIGCSIVTPEARKAFAKQIKLTKCQFVPQRGECSALHDGGNPDGNKKKAAPRAAYTWDPGGTQGICEANKID